MRKGPGNETVTDEARDLQWRAMLAAELAALDTSDTLGSDDRRTVELDQQSVGRLSRMDALQRQAMADAQAARRATRRRRIRAALSRLDAGEFGYCEDCGERIPDARLALDPTAPLCVDCAST